MNVECIIECCAELGSDVIGNVLQDSLCLLMFLKERSNLTELELWGNQTQLVNFILNLFIQPLLGS